MGQPHFPFRTAFLELGNLKVLQLPEFSIQHIGWGIMGVEVYTSAKWPSLRNAVLELLEILRPAAEGISFWLGQDLSRKLTLECL